MEEQRQDWYIDQQRPGRLPACRLPNLAEAVKLRLNTEKGAVAGYEAVPLFEISFYPKRGFNSMPMIPSSSRHGTSDQLLLEREKPSAMPLCAARHGGDW